jgi:thiamine phosphate synthase YjbQ (UPF0047 family)
MVNEFSIKTDERYQLRDITKEVEEIVAKSNVDSGLCLVFVAHSTAAIILTENESGLKNDWEHDRIDDNADSHILSGLLGQGKVLPIENGRIIRGTWQNIFLVELDGPRTRRITINIIKG